MVSVNRVRAVSFFLQAHRPRPGTDESGASLLASYHAKSTEMTIPRGLVVVVCG